jgi:anti-anti-sigma regulatory factor
MSPTNDFYGRRKLSLLLKYMQVTCYNFIIKNSFIVLRLLGPLCMQNYEAFIKWVAMINVFRVPGDIGQVNVQKLHAAFEALASSGQDHILDMRDVRKLDEAGIGALVFLLKRARARGNSVEIINLHGQPLELFESLRLKGAFAARAARNPVAPVPLFAEAYKLAS